jgi:hypothetical protein
MALTERDTPALQPAKPETIDSGKVRLGSAGITASFPPLRRPDPKIADSGTVRLGSAGITATFPPR